MDGVQFAHHCATFRTHVVTSLISTFAHMRTTIGELPFANLIVQSIRKHRSGENYTAHGSHIKLLRTV
jgi:ABC-type enterochelin transport system permease subunit